MSRLPMAARVSALLLTLGAAACYGQVMAAPEPATLTAPKPDTKLIDRDGIGPLRVGMSRASAEALGVKVDGVANTVECVAGAMTGQQVNLLLENSIVTRITVSDPDYATERGIRVGSSAAEVKSAYGADLAISPHKYEDNGYYYAVIDPQGRGFVFEILNDDVVLIHVGRLPALQYVEGCS